MFKKLKQLVFFAEPTSALNGRVALGLAGVLNAKLGWQVNFIRPDDDIKNIAEVVRRLKPEALVIHWVFSPEIMNFFLTLGIPLVIACVDYYPHLDLPIVDSDNLLIGQMAANHFLERSIEHFVWIGYRNIPRNGENIATARVAGYRDRLRVLHFRIEEVWIPLPDYHVPLFDHTTLIDHLEDWLRALPLPCGIMTDGDTLGASVVRLCLRNRIRVPADIAVLGTGNDVIACNLSQPNLSSIAEPFEEIGKKCAEIVRKWDRAHPPGRQIFPVAPLRVVTRASTEAQAIRDPVVLAAVKYIAANIEKSYKIDSLLKATGVSQQTLVTHFKKHLRRTPIMEIHRQKIERAKCLLAETNESASDIAKRCGMNDATNFSRVFKNLTGVPPQEYRRRTQNRF